MVSSCKAASHGVAHVASSTKVVHIILIALTDKITSVVVVATMAA